MTFNKKLFISIESFIYVCFLVLDIISINSKYIKYLGIILCFIYCLNNKNKYRITAMFFTVIADYFLLIKDDYYLVGVLSFIIVQALYYLYLNNKYLN